MKNLLALFVLLFVGCVHRGAKLEDGTYSQLICDMKPNVSMYAFTDSMVVDEEGYLYLYNFKQVFPIPDRPKKPYLTIMQKNSKYYVTIHGNCEFKSIGGILPKLGLIHVEELNYAD